MRGVRVVVIVLACALVTRASPADANHSGVAFASIHETAGLSIGVPEGWRVAHGRRTPCTNPVERLTLVGEGALLHVQEALPPLRSLAEMPPRPRPAVVDGEPDWIACCSPRDAKGWVIPFRDGQRAFYAYVYPARHGSATAALAALDSLLVSARA